MSGRPIMPGHVTVLKNATMAIDTRPDGTAEVRILHGGQVLVIELDAKNRATAHAAFAPPVPKIAGRHGR